jgi:hypothetical protein
MKPKNKTIQQSMENFINEILPKATKKVKESMFNQTYQQYINHKKLK